MSSLSILKLANAQNMKLQNNVLVIIMIRCDLLRIITYLNISHTHLATCRNYPYPITSLPLADLLRVSLLYH